MSYSKRFRVEPGIKGDLAKIDAAFKNKQESQDHAAPEIEMYIQMMSEEQ